MCRETTGSFPCTTTWWMVWTLSTVLIGPISVAQAALEVEGHAGVDRPAVDVQGDHGFLPLHHDLVDGLDLVHGVDRPDLGSTGGARGRRPRRSRSAGCRCAGRPRVPSPAPRPGGWSGPCPRC